jgi:hypothetical protein
MTGGRERIGGFCRVKITDSSTWALFGNAEE